MTEPKVITKKEFFTHKVERESEYVDLTEFGFDGGVYIFEMTASQGDKYQGELFNVSPDGQTVSMRTENMGAKLIALTACDKNGRRIFKFEEVKEIGKQNKRVVDKLTKVATKLNGLEKDFTKGLEKNLKESQSKDSDTD